MIIYSNVSKGIVFWDTIIVTADKENFRRNNSIMIIIFPQENPFMEALRQAQEQRQNRRRRRVSRHVECGPEGYQRLAESSSDEEEEEEEAEEEGEEQREGEQGQDKSVACRATSQSATGECAACGCHDIHTPVSLSLFKCTSGFHSLS